MFTTKDYVFKTTDKSFNVFRCASCGCGFVWPRPTEEDILSFYPKEYYWWGEQSRNEVSWDDIINKRREQLIAKEEWLKDLPAGNLLDIGAQKGEFIWWMQQRGWSADGVEIDNSVPNPLNLPIIYGDFLSLELGEEKYDCVTMWAVLEHVRAPHRFIKRISKLLKPGGCFIATVTNFNSIQGRIYRLDDYPRHLTLFTKKSVRQLCGRYGLQLDRCITDQRLYGGALNGGGVYAVKRILGYSKDDARYEWRNVKDPNLFYAKFKGKHSSFVLTVSRIDRLITLPLEKILDLLGFGFNMTFRCYKPR